MACPFSGPRENGGEVKRTDSPMIMETDGEPVAAADTKRLNLRHLTKAVGTFILIPTNFLGSALHNLLTKLNADAWKKLRQALKLRDDQLSPDPGATYVFDGAEIIKDIMGRIQPKAGVELHELWRRLGREFTLLCYKEFPSALKCVGSTVQDLFGSMDSFHGHLVKADEFRNYRWSPPYLRCAARGDDLDIQYAIDADRPLDYLNFMAGVIEQAAVSVFNVEVGVEAMHMDDLKENVELVSNFVGEPKAGAVVQNYVYRVSVKEKVGSAAHKSAVSTVLNRHPEKLSQDPKDLPVKPGAFCAAFPFHFMFDRDLQLQQMGVGLLRIFSSMLASDLSVLTYFSVVTPRLTTVTFDSIKLTMHVPFRLALREIKTSQQTNLAGMELKGQMSFCPESNLIIFIGSPVVEKLEELTGRGLYISDIPIHDATRDVILVGEQTKAQDGLKKRMDKLKNSIEEANRAVEEERQKNVDLLHLIFPPDVAKKLWLGQPVDAETIDEVTMLFSDIVGFTAICGISTPMMVIDMLNGLYTRFDAETVNCDVYKLETIGDAFICVGGLHNRPAPWHSQQVAWMALRMMSHAKKQIAPDGNAIRVRRSP
ncbi:hypothetical protein RvY_11525-2 [Ramazzottius varieornatus]|uniref:guanylate cyclase n=1 Tax=Ramazzottius varieornatus TaxID=947166 RepID=A0A1D1VQ86_RAMVA|nr:hypothetical protein RvY_11525-2 [Ramazzottius varieornatus]